MTTKKATYQYDNGTGWDEIMFKTTADQVLRKDGKTIQDFFDNGANIGNTITFSTDYSGIKHFSKSKKSWWNYIHPDINNYVLASDTSGASREEYSFTSSNIIPHHGNKDLGTQENPWKNVYIDGVSKSTNGYTKLPNGMIMQWGEVILDIEKGKARQIINYPIAFPNKCVTVITNLDGVDGSGEIPAIYFNIHASHKNFNNFEIFATNNINEWGTKLAAYWIAIGY